MGGEEGEGEWGEDGGVTHRVQGPGAEGSDASREGLGESTYTQRADVSNRAPQQQLVAEGNDPQTTRK